MTGRAVTDLTILAVCALALLAAAAVLDHARPAGHPDDDETVIEQCDRCHRVRRRQWWQPGRSHCPACVEMIRREHAEGRDAA